MLPYHWTTAPRYANETPGNWMAVGWPVLEAGLDPGPLHRTRKGGGGSVTDCGTRNHKINIDVAVDRTILGFGGFPGAASGGKRGP